MPDMIRSGASWLADRLAASAAVTVTYKRGDGVAKIKATIGRSTFESTNQNGVIENWESRDFLVKTAELPYGEPYRGDLIVEEAADGVETVYEVSAPRGVPLFHFADAFELVCRVHTKRSDKSLTYIVTEGGEEIAVPIEGSQLDDEIVVPIVA